MLVNFQQQQTVQHLVKLMILTILVLVVMRTKTIQVNVVQQQPAKLMIRPILVCAVMRIKTILVNVISFSMHGYLLAICKFYQSGKIYQSISSNNCKYIERENYSHILCLIWDVSFTVQISAICGTQPYFLVGLSSTIFRYEQVRFISTPQYFCSH